MTIHLREIYLKQSDGKRSDYPFNLPIIQSDPRLTFDRPVTFLVGENGCGKSTLMEAIAYAADTTVVGSLPLDEDPTLIPIKPLANALRLIWNNQFNRGFFLRAEDFFGFVKRVNRLQAELKAEEKEIAEEFEGRSDYATGLALGPVRGELASLKSKYGDGLDTMSHGESFLKLFQSRFVPNGLYLLDEPETPLSPLRQIALLAQIQEMVKADCQFIIATHSPILMAYPDAQLLNFVDGQITPTPYDELEHVTLTRDFLADPDQFLRYL